MNQRLFLSVFFLLILAGSFIRVTKLNEFPIDEGRADMLDTIISQIKDYTEGGDPYTTFVTGKGRTLPRFYLPVLWLSYTPFYMVGVDIRFLNLIVQMFILLLLLHCFLKSENNSPLLFLASIALFCFSKQKIAEVLDVQTAVFWLFYALVLWGEWNQKHWVTHLCIPVVLVCRHPAVLFFLPFFLYLLLENRKRFWNLVLHCAVLCPLLIFPFMKNPRNILDCILYFGGSFKDVPVDITSRFFGLSSLLQRTGTTFLQWPLQLSGLVAMLWMVLKKKCRGPLEALALGGISYITFMLFVSATPQYVWAEPLILIYFLMNRPMRKSDPLIVQRSYTE